MLESSLFYRGGPCEGAGFGGECGMRLPVEEKRREICEGLRGEFGRLLLKAPTGSGKSTMVPQFLCDEVTGGMVLVVQPRRMAARLLAQFVAKSRGGRVGEEVGFAVRMESKKSVRTRVLFVTDGVLQRMLSEEGGLRGVGAVVFDEFHERRLASDLCLGRVLELQEGSRPDLKVVVMSATLEAGGLRDFLDPCAVVETEGKRYPVEIRHRGEAVVQKGGRGRPPELWDRVAGVVRSELEELAGGERILVFLPGVFEIRRCERLLTEASWARGVEVKPLFSALAMDQQEAALRVDGSRRVILATNVAETSVTIEGVTVVVDSGLARVGSYDAGRGMDALRVEKISQAAATQRAGRAGRMGPGRCARLWSEADHRGRDEFEMPEVRRMDLGEAALLVRRWGGNEVRDFRWLEAPDELRAREAERVLALVGATEKGEAGLTEFGEWLGGWGLAPRLGRILWEGLKRGCAAEASFVVAALQGEGVIKRGKRGGSWADFCEDEREDGLDFAGEWHAAEAAEKVRFRGPECDRWGVSGRGARETLQLFDQLISRLQKRGVQVGEVAFGRRADEVRQCLLAAFPDRVAVLRGVGVPVFERADGQRGKLEPKSSAKGAELVVVTESAEIEGKTTEVVFSRVATIREDWLDGVEEREEVVFDSEQRRVMAVRQRVWLPQGTIVGGPVVVLSEKRGGEVDPEKAQVLLAAKLIEGDLKLKNWDGKVERWIARLRFLAETMPELELPTFDPGDREMVLAELCEGATSYREVKTRDPWPVLRDFLSKPQAAALEAYAPEKVTLANGINTRVNYQESEEPWVGERVQRLFGVKKTPTLPGGQLLVVKIQAPNQRPWQVTKDLEGFWERGFAQMKKDLAGRYPKHKWEPD